jgi:prepilin-type N-terminal cleavage/methylation domain-containing protein/prepilin-type processing-associated H-X9-DG protein
MSPQDASRRRPRRAFTLVEMLVVTVILSLLIALCFPVYSRILDSGRAAGSMSNLHQLALANLAYAADNGGAFCPAQEPRNLVRWHGARTSRSGAFDPTKGFLAPYLGETGRVKVCPLFADMLKGSSSFENGTGGYGYNAAYIGGTPADPYQPLNAARVPHPSRTVMFATTAFARSSGLQEYPYSEPWQWVDPNGVLSGSLQPSVHFRANGKALVAWCDGHVTAEPPTKLGGTDVYGGDSEAEKIGWFGPDKDNGWWNPDYDGP